MIYSIEGTLDILELLDAHYLAAVVCGGVAYEIKTSFTSAQACPKIGESVRFYTYLHTREGVLDLYGFTELQERRCFLQLISVSGVGPKAALSILSTLSPSQLILCILSGDSKSISQSKGVGAKTAQRILLELKDRFDDSLPETNAVLLPAASNLSATNASEAIHALLALGYSKAEASQAVGKLDPQSSVEDLLKAALKALAVL